MSDRRWLGSAPASPSIKDHLTGRAASDSLTFALERSRVRSVPVWKRVLDLVVILSLTPVLLPLVIVLSLLVKLTSKGSIFFRQERIGLHQQPFTLLKFRTMIAGNDTCVHSDYVDDLITSDKPMTKLDTLGDARLIPTARWIRALGLDELPQLINVLRGEMSLVGPRPCLPSEAQRYGADKGERFATLPGLTGLWQVSGKNQLTFSQMVELDIRYVRSKSLWLDLTILARTIPALIKEVRNLRKRSQSNAK